MLFRSPQNPKTPKPHIILIFIIINQMEENESAPGVSNSALKQLQQYREMMQQRLSRQLSTGGNAPSNSFQASARGSETGNNNNKIQHTTTMQSEMDDMERNTFQFNQRPSSMMIK